MIGVDTNVLVRHLTQDDPAQSRAATRFFAARTADDPAYISLVALVETVWVLRRAYGIEAAAVTRVIRGLLSVREVVVPAPDVVRRAVDDAEQAGTDLADAIIAHLAVAAGADGTVTFDRRAAELPAMRLLPIG